MALILYLPDDKGWNEQFTASLQNTSPDTEYTICHSIDRFAEILRTQFCTIRVAMIVVQNRKDFQRIYALKDFLEGLFLLLVLPDEDSETIAQAHRLSPRFIAQLNGDRSEMNNVLRRMLERYDCPAFNTAMQ